MLYFWYNVRGLPQGGSLKYVSLEMLLIKITEDENIFKSSSVIRPARTEVYQGYEADGIFRQPDLWQTQCWLLVPLLGQEDKILPNSYMSSIVHPSGCVEVCPCENENPFNNTPTVIKDLEILHPQLYPPLSS